MLSSNPTIGQTFFGKESDSKYFRFCELFGLCCQLLSSAAVAWKQYRQQRKTERGCFSKVLLIETSSSQCGPRAIAGWPLVYNIIPLNQSQTFWASPISRTDQTKLVGLSPQTAYDRVGWASVVLERNPARNIITENAGQTVTTLRQAADQGQIEQKEGNAQLWQGGLGEETRQLSGLSLQSCSDDLKSVRRGKPQTFKKQRGDDTYIYKGGKHRDMQDELMSLAG